MTLPIHIGAGEIHSFDTGEGRTVVLKADKAKRISALHTDAAGTTHLLVGPADLDTAEVIARNMVAGSMDGVGLTAARVVALGFMALAATLGGLRDG